MFILSEIGGRLLMKGYSLLDYKIWFNRVDISGDIVDNNKNNQFSGGEVCRIGDKLYFDYDKSEIHSGLIEISKRGAKKLYCYSPFDSSFDVGPLYTFPGKDKLYFFSYYEGFQEVDPKTGIFQKSDEIFETYRCNKLLFYENKKYYYVVPKDLINPKKLNGDYVVLLQFENQSGYNRFLPIENNDYFYPHRDKVYYVEYQKRPHEWVDPYERPGKTYVYDETTGEIKEFLPFSVSFVIDNDYMIFKKKNEDETTSLFKYKLDQTEEMKEIKNMGKVPFHLNACNGKVYTSSIGGVKEIDLETFEEKTLTKHQALGSCYIVDNKWVYFVNEKELWRVSQDGKTTEKVFG